MTQSNLLQREILDKIIEEASELIKACSKANQHGIETPEPGTSAPTNKDKIESESGDLIFWLGVAMQYGVLNMEAIQKASKLKATNAFKYTHYIPE